MLAYPFQEHKKLLSMGLSRLNIEDWLIEDALLQEQIALKKSLHASNASAVYQCLPSSVNAQLELASEIAGYLPNAYPSLYAVSKDQLHCKFNDSHLPLQDDEKTLLWNSWAVQEDLCLLQAGSAGDYILTAASLCAPSYWRLMDKIGKSLDHIHGPIPEYEAQLSHSVNRFFEKLKVSQPVWRANWSVVTQSDLFQPGDSEASRILSTEHIATRCFIRTERQTLRRLPKSQAVVFTIRVSIEPIVQIASNRAVLNDLLQALSAMSEAEKTYKSLDRIEPALSSWLLQRLNLL